MNALKPDNSIECRAVQERLSDYIENTLPARETWELEKHLSQCVLCAEQLRQMQSVVSLLRQSERRDTGDDFMASLHARLDALEPEAMRPRPLRERWREGLADALQTLRGYRAPALGASLVAIALVTVFFVKRPEATPTPAATPTVAKVPAEVLRQNVAIAASNPLEDPVAATLEAHSATNENASPAANEESGAQGG